MLQNILINLNILSKIKPYDKIYINSDNLITIEYSSIFQGIYRFFYNKNRERNLTNLVIFYQTVYSTIDDLLNSQYLNTNNNDNIINYIKNDNDEFSKSFSNLNKINHYLELSITGIDNLKKTYHGDIVTDSKLDIIINNCEMYMEKIKKKINNVNLISILIIQENPNLIKQENPNLIKSDNSNLIKSDNSNLIKSGSKNKLL